MNFSRYVSTHVLEKIIEGGLPTKLEGERKKITVLFSDIRRFTLLAEKMPPEEVVDLLNEFFEEMIDVIFENNGTLDKFTGDGVMVGFGSPLSDPFQEKHAIMTALEMQERLHVLRERWQKEGKPRVDMGIGVHTGIAVVGHIGSTKRMEYTAIGDTVNVAARLEQETKNAKVPILISEETFKALPTDEFNSKKLGTVNLPGRVGSVTVYSIEQKW